MDATATRAGSVPACLTDRFGWSSSAWHGQIRDRTESRCSKNLRSLVTVISLCLLASLTACGPTAESGKRQPSVGVSAEAGFRQSREQVGKAAERLLEGRSPVTDRTALAARLKLDRKRVEVFTTQPVGPIAFDSGANCKAGRCTCVGDRDCNDMFSTICLHPSSGGSCETAGSQVVCTCMFSDDIPTPVEPG